MLSKPLPTSQVYLLYLCKSTIFVKKGVIRCFFLDKTLIYLYNGTKAHREIPLYPRFPLNSSFHTPPGVPAGVFFCLNPFGTLPTRSFHTHIDNLKNTKLLSGLHSKCTGGGVALAHPPSQQYLFVPSVMPKDAPAPNPHNKRIYTNKTRTSHHRIYPANTTRKANIQVHGKKEPRQTS